MRFVMTVRNLIVSNSMAIICAGNVGAQAPEVAGRLTPTPSGGYQLVATAGMSAVICEDSIQGLHQAQKYLSGLLTLDEVSTRIGANVIVVFRSPFEVRDLRAESGSRGESRACATITQR